MNETLRAVLKKNARSRGFTIVELLIVVVVIAILAAITIVAYSGVKNRASSASVLADINSSTKVLMNEATINSGTYPAVNPVASSGSNTSVYKTYMVDGSSTINAFCLAVTNTAANTTYYTTNTNSTPTQGACPVVTNLATNPSFESSSAGVNWYKGPSGAASFGVTTNATAYQGTKITYITWSTAPTGSGGVYYGTSAEAVTAGQTYMYSGYVRPSKAINMAASTIWLNSASNSIGSPDVGQTVLVPANVWTRLSVKAVAPASSVAARISLYATDSPSWAAGDQLQADGIMLTQGSTLYNYDAN